MSTRYLCCTPLVYIRCTSSKTTTYNMFNDVFESFFLWQLSSYFVRRGCFLRYLYIVIIIIIIIHVETILLVVFFKLDSHHSLSVFRYVPSLNPGNKDEKHNTTYVMQLSNNNNNNKKYY